jgi:hypothetical protein
VCERLAEIEGSKSVKAELGQNCGEGQDRARAKEPIGGEGGMS